ncbi:hypothetical protein [Allocoleopsis sp.]|uniref:hypothetical protein n=1 Tax=Allocoleopsis sp. TaxID=3088169 RepID=UPI002FD27AD1
MKALVLNCTLKPSPQESNTEDCQRFANDAQMQACAEVCRRCAESYREMAMAAV